MLRHDDPPEAPRPPGSHRSGSLGADREAPALRPPVVSVVRTEIALTAGHLSFTHPSPISAYSFIVARWRMNRRMPRPEDVSRDHIDTTVVGFLKGERDEEWTEVSLLTLHPREEVRLVLSKNADRYRSLNDGRFQELVRRLKPLGVSLRRSLAVSER